MVAVFVSYSHRQDDWVRDRLVPVLNAGGAQVLIDEERFKAGRAVIRQMDKNQDRADRQVLCLSADYLASEYCRHEMERAMALDPRFERGVVIPVRLDNAAWPSTIDALNPLYVDLRNDLGQQPWRLLLDACRASLGIPAPAWLASRDEILRHVQRNQSVNLVVRSDGIAWRALIRHPTECHFPDLAWVDLQDGRTSTRDGLLNQILNALGMKRTVRHRPKDLGDFQTIIETLPPPVRLVTSHFDLAKNRKAYGVDFFSTLRWLIMEERKLVLLAQSRTPFAALLPRDHPLSAIDMRTVELG